MRELPERMSPVFYLFHLLSENEHEIFSIIKLSYSLPKSKTALILKKTNTSLSFGYDLPFVPFYMVSNFQLIFTILRLSEGKERGTTKKPLLLARTVVYIGGAVKRTRTSTSLLTLEPESSASANSAMTANYDYVIVLRPDAASTLH